MSRKDEFISWPLYLFCLSTGGAAGQGEAAGGEAGGGEAERGGPAGGGGEGCPPPGGGEAEGLGGAGMDDLPVVTQNSSHEPIRRVTSPVFPNSVYAQDPKTLCFKLPESPATHSDLYS